MIQRLLELMRMKNLTSSQLADTIKVQRSGISHFVSGRNKPSLEFILKILNHFPDVNPDWMLFGRDPVYRDGTFVLPSSNSESNEPEKFQKIINTEETSDQPSLFEELFEKGKAPQKKVLWRDVR